jgi:hypothetical protein
VTPEQRVLRARLAAHTMHARNQDPTAHTAPARAAFDQRFYDEVDPDGVLPARERERRAAHARAAYFARLSLAAVKARQAKAS